MKKYITEESYVESYTRKNGTIGYRTINNDPSITNADGAEAADINNIVRDFNRTGRWPVGTRQGLYTGDNDITIPSDLIAAHEMIKNANDKFNELPSNVRERFHNDPIRLHEFLSDPKNLKEAEKLGLITVQKKNDDSNDENLTAQSKPTRKTAQKSQNIPDPE